MPMNMGADSVYTYTAGVRFEDGTVQTTAVVKPQVGVAIFTGGNASSVAFATQYVGNSAPIVVVTGSDGVVSDGLFFSVSMVGSPGAWTGFTLKLSGNLFGAFNWLAAGNPD